MPSETLSRASPETAEEAASVLRRSADGGGQPVRIAGAGTKPWGSPGARAATELCTSGLGRIVEHNEGDFTAVLEAGVPLAEAQGAFAAAGQMLAVDPPLGEGDAATVGGVFATADAGPLRHRYGAPRDLIVGATLSLPDGTVARAGGKVIKNVAGYDLAKLFTGAFGTLGLLARVAVRLHPLPAATATTTAATDDPDTLALAASTIAHSPLETECLDVRWRDGRGCLLARFGGAAAGDQAAAAGSLLEAAGADVSTSLVEDDDSLWAAQRAGQRARRGAAVKVSALPASLATVIRATERAEGSLVGRAGHGISWVSLPDGAPDALVPAIGELREALEPFPCVVLDAPEAARGAVDVWGEPEGGRLALSRRLKARFDPQGVCNPGVFVGGI